MSRFSPPARVAILVFLGLLLLNALYLAYHFGLLGNSPPTPSKKVVTYSFAAPTRVIDFTTMADGTPLPTTVWNFEEGNQVASYNHEAQTYTSRPSNVRVEAGTLIIEAHLETLNERSYTSARLNTKGTFDFQYGKIEVEALLPPGIGVWPAFWLRSSDGSNYANSGNLQAEPFAWALNGEIDFMEAQGARPGLIFVNAHTMASLTAGGNPNQGQIAVPDMYTQYHVYGVEWTPTSLTFTLDGQPFHQVLKTDDSLQNWPFDHAFHLVINLALGGDWAMSLNERLSLGFANGIDEAQAANWQLRVKSIKYSPLVIG